MIKPNLKYIFFPVKTKKYVIFCRTQISICLLVCNNYQWKTWVLLKIEELSSIQLLLSSERRFEPRCSESQVDVEDGISSIPWMTLICFHGICSHSCDLRIGIPGSQYLLQWISVAQFATASTEKFSLHQLQPWWLLLAGRNECGFELHKDRKDLDVYLQHSVYSDWSHKYLLEDNQLPIVCKYLI